LDLRGEGEIEQERSSTPTDEKSRKKRSMKLEVGSLFSRPYRTVLTQQHLVHQQANRRLGVEYNVSKFESKGTRYLPDPETAPKSPGESANEVQEFRPEFSADIKAPTVRPFIKQVIADVTHEWDMGMSAGEPETSHDKIREAVEIYWVRLAVSV
jgi:hypothetical protein